MTNIRSELELILKISKETIRDGFEISVPLLELELQNIGSRALAVPKEGDSLLFSLRLSLKREGRTIIHGVCGRRPDKLEMDPLLPGKSKKTLLSPLSHGFGETPLDVGTYEARVWVIPQSDLSFDSIFAVEFGEICSNMVPLTVNRII
jgi:hypothetical protein